MAAVPHDIIPRAPVALDGVPRALAPHATLSRVITSTVTPEGDGMMVRRAFPSQRLARLDPFLVFDEMGPLEIEPGSEAGFPDHPHRGFETVTYILEGSVEHRDSHGHAGRIGPGDVQWMTAGAGVVHSEMPGADLRKSGGVLHGFQLWVNLPKADKMMRPRYQEILAKDIPEVRTPDGKGTVRILAGSFGGRSAVIDTRTPIQYLHVRLDPDATTEVKIPSGHQGFVLCPIGAAEVGGKSLVEGSYGIVSGAGPLAIRAGPEGGHLLVVTGVPLKEPVFQYGPFVMTTRDEIIQAVEDFNAGRFGEIPAQAAGRPVGVR